MVHTNPHLQDQQNNENDPLLNAQSEERSYRSLSQGNEIEFNDNNDAESKYDEFKRELKAFSKRRFWWFCSLGVIAIIIMHLSFLPRTSLSRDFRRWHGLHLTKSDVKRNYLLFSSIGRTYNAVPNEDYINWWLSNFTTINHKSDVNLVGGDNVELVSYVESNFNKLGYETETFSYDVPELQKPISLSLRLLDSNNGKVVYDAPLVEPSSNTPAYNGFGLNGTEVGGYIFVNEATNEDFQLLLKNNIDPKGKIVIARINTESSLSASEKLQIAQYYHASGIIIYNDLTFGQNNKKHDNLLQSAIQRDSVWFDCSTDLSAHNIPSIPSIPVSFKSIKPILDTLALNPNNNAFKNWDYYPTTLSDSFSLEMSADFAAHSKRKLTNVIGSINGIIRDGEIVIGASRDSFTSSNPLSNHVILLEIMRNFQRLVKLGWKPLRNIKFISWDGSHNGLLGSKLLTNDTNSFNIKQPTLAYINIDGDAIMGSHFKVDANPMFNHILKKTSRFIPIPKSSTHFKLLPKRVQESFSGSEDEIDEHNNNNGDDYTTLHSYWLKQDNISINNLVGELIKSSDASVFQNYLGTPVVNVKFENDPKRDSSVYIPNSNYYSYEWLTKRKIDNDFLLHGLLIRYLGLLTISLCEREVIDTRTVHYFKQINLQFKKFTEENESRLIDWSKRKIPQDLISKFKLFSEVKGDIDSDTKSIKLSMLVRKFQSLANDLVGQALAFDIYNGKVAELWIEDFAWYKLLKKLKIFAQLKLANYRLLHFEKEFTLKPKDHLFLYGDADQKNGPDHVIYGVPPFSVNETNAYFETRVDRSIFPHLYQATREDNFEMFVKWLAVTYEKLRNLSNKMT